MVNVWEKLAPVERIPESQSSGPAVALLVEEWGEPIQTQVIVSPGTMVTVLGLNAIPGPTLTV